MRKLTCCILALALIGACAGPAPEEPANHGQGTSQNPGGGNNNSGGTNDNPGGGNENPGGTNDNPGGGQGTVTPDFTPESWYDTPFWERTDREKAGLRGPVKQWHVSAYASYVQYEYDQAGHLLKIKDYDSDGELNYLTTFEYDSDGNRIKKTVVAADDASTVEEVTTYSYGNPGKIVVLDRYLYHGRLSQEHSAIIEGEDIMMGVSAIHTESLNSIQYTSVMDRTFEFDEEGNLTVKEHSYLADKFNNNQPSEFGEYEGTFHWTYVGGYPYSSDGGVTAMTWQANGMPLTWESAVEETTYTWDGPYRVDKCEWYENKRTLDFKSFQHVEGYVGGYLADYWRKKEFGEHDELIHMSFDVFNDGRQFDYYYTDYKYDSHGNWISRKEDTTAILDGNRSVTEVTREIVYY